MSSPWKCPHCGTPQAEAARCWSCKRSPLACSTCHDFRRSVAGRLGYCGKDKARAVLTGDEIRPCWSAPASVEEPPLIGLFGSLEPTPARPAPRPRPAPARPPVPPVFSAPEPLDLGSVAAEVFEPPTDAPQAPDAPDAPATTPLTAPPRRAVPVERGPAPTAAVAARRRWDAIIADVAAGHPLGSEPAGGAMPSVPHRPVPGTTPVLPWLAPAVRATDVPSSRPGEPSATQGSAVNHVRPTASTATVTPPTGTPTVTSAPATPAAVTHGASDEDAFAAWAATDPSVMTPTAQVAAPADRPAPWSRTLPAPIAPLTDTGTLALPPRTTPAPWTAPMPSESPDWAMSAEDLTPSEPIRWRHRSIDDPVPPPTARIEDAPARRATSLSLLPATLANRLRRHLGTRGPRTDVVPPPLPGAASTGPSASTASLTSPSVRGATPIATTTTTPYGRLVEAPPVTGTIMSLGDQLRRAEQIRRERALLDDQRLAGERGIDPPA